MTTTRRRLHEALDKVSKQIILAADSVKVEPSSEKPTPSVKDLADDRPENVMDTPDDWVLTLDEVKKALPPIIADTLKKELFKGKGKVTVKQIKDKIGEIEEDDDQFWVSVQDWSGLQKAWKDKPQIVIQINITDKIKQEIRKSPLVSDFMDDFFKFVGENAHPAHTQTLAWARVYRFPDKWIIEEIQSDLFGATRDISKDANDHLKRNVMKRYNDKEVAEVAGWLMERFEDWDKQLIGLVINMARKAGVKDIYMFDEDWKNIVYKQYNHDGPAKSQMKKFYNKNPRELGFRKGKLDVGDNRRQEAWHRAVANVWYLSA